MSARRTPNIPCPHRLSRNPSIGRPWSNSRPDVGWNYECECGNFAEVWELPPRTLGGVRTLPILGAAIEARQAVPAQKRQFEAD